jgi:hypothetical protein
VDLPSEDAADARLRDPHVVCVVAYASAGKVLREVLITASDTKLARILNSINDSQPALAVTGGDNSKRLRLTFEDNYPSPPVVRTIEIPIVNDDLDVAHAKLPPGFQAAVWKR